jgi:hypothetical protein
LLINELQKPGNDKLFDEFKKRIKVLDTHREININEYIPSIGKIFYE